MRHPEAALRQAARRLAVAGWLPPLITLAVVLAAGSRLILLSVQASASEQRQAAQRTAQQRSQALGRELAILAGQALHPAAAPVASSGQAGLLPLDARFQPSTGAQVGPAIARALAAELRNGVSTGPAQAVLIGPLRQGSQWLIAACAASPTGWAVAYESVDVLVARAQLPQLLGSGYDFALVQSGRGGRSVLASTRTEPLSTPVSLAIAVPAEAPFAAAGSRLALELQPRNGWYPLGTLATDIGLLALVAWMVTFAAHDLTQRTRRLQLALLATRQRIQSLQDRLASEVNERQKLQQTFEHARYHDAFTGLPNRRYFMDQLDRALRELRLRQRRRIAVLLIEIDRFALVHQTLGHSASDELMVQAAHRVQKALPTAAVLARWGGGQLGLLLLEVSSPEEALRHARLLQGALSDAFEVRRQRLGVSARIGLTCLDAGPRRAEDVVREADIALAVARRREEAACILYTAGMGGDVASLVSLEADLHVALEREELRVLLQPIVHLSDRLMVGAEVLLRWAHPIEGLLAPQQFLPIAEEAGLIAPITRWTVQRACALAREWQVRLPPHKDFYLSVNLAPPVLRDPAFGAYMSQLLRTTHVAPERVKLEVTESGLMSDAGAVRDTLEQLHGLGIELMLDDFGTGYSSLNHLQLFPFDYVKIDRPRVDLKPDAVDPRADGRALTSAMVRLASSLGLTPIAEVIETESAAKTLDAMGCHFGQGFFFCEPVAAEDALRCLRGEEFSRSWRPELESEHDDDDSPTLILPSLSQEDVP